MLPFLEDTIYLEFLCMGDLTFCLHLLIYSVIHLYQYALTDLYFIPWVLIQNYFFFCSHSFSFDFWAISVGSYASLTYVHQHARGVLITVSLFCFFTFYP